MWNFCDDHGNHPASVRTLKMEIFPADDISSGEISQLTGELISNGLLVLYEAEGKQYWHVTGWRHQKIEKPNRKYPGLDSGTILRHVGNQSTTNRRTVCDQTPEEVDVDVDIPSLEMEIESSYPLEIATEQRAKMSIIDFRFVHQDKFGTNMPPGCNQTAHELCQQYSRESIINAFEAAAVQGKQSVAYVKGVLLGNGNGGKPAPQQRVTKTFEQIKLENTKQAMMDFVKGAPDAGHEREPQAICITHG
jgi:hypothetical protein